MLDIIKKKFEEIYKTEPLLVRSPGRVNLIGEHTDYNEGFVLPAAVNKAIYFAISKRNDGMIKIYSKDFNEYFDGSVTNIQKSGKGWPNYLLGIVEQLTKNEFEISGFNCVFGGDIPIASGMSSSAAIEGGLIFALSELYNLKLEKINLVKMAQAAENQFVGVQCGIMDQFINIFGQSKKVLKLDCRSLDYELYPFERDDLRIVLCDTQVRRELAGSEYNVRRKQCESGVHLLKKIYPRINSLRDVTVDLLYAHKKEFDPLIYKRCEYVVKENDRVVQACSDLERNDFQSFGQKMLASHEGLKNDYEVSSTELDILVESARKINGVLGARMMGAGFGGCTINLVKEDALNNFIEEITPVFIKKLNVNPKIYVTKIEAGTSIQSSIKTNDKVSGKEVNLEKV
ncbi:MAG: galactokinase [Calditrichia bacterium]